MVKKISKHSRTAKRRGENLLNKETLSDLPIIYKTDLANALIRTASKNEALLEAKLNKKRKNKKVNKIIKTEAVDIKKGKLEHALNITSKLTDKIEKSILRAKYVQSARKAGWESTNSSIKRELSLIQGKIPFKEKIEEKESQEDIIEGKNKLLENQIEFIEGNNNFNALLNDVEV